MIEKSITITTNDHDHDWVDHDHDSFSQHRMGQKAYMDETVTIKQK